jgi:hypothetical protein
MSMLVSMRFPPESRFALRLLGSVILAAPAAADLRPADGGSDVRSARPGVAETEPWERSALEAQDGQPAPTPPAPAPPPESSSTPPVQSGGAAPAQAPAANPPAPAADPAAPAKQDPTPPPVDPVPPPANPPAEIKPAPAPEATPPVPAPAAPAFPAFEPKYRTLDSVQLLLAEWTKLRADLAHPLAYGALADGRPLPALEFGAPGAVALDQRPTVLLLGGLDGRSLAGGEAVLACASELLREPEKLPPEIAFLAVPWASPEALELYQSGRAIDGRNARPQDEDRDGLLDEDGPDDLDGDGLLLQLLIEDPTGPWARAADPRFLVRAGPGDAPRYLLTMEGRDDDGDGRFNEDGPGGVVLDLNFPVGRRGPWTGELNGALPMSEPLTRSLADLALKRRVALALFFQGNHGELAIPGGFAAQGAGPALVEAADRPVFERATALFRQATGRHQSGLLTLRGARGSERRGAALDWFYAVTGALSLELAPWGPRIEMGGEGGGEVAAENARFPTEPASSVLAPAAAEEDRAWAAWLDNTRGGLGFVDWHPVELGGGAQGLVGGWERNTRFDPPPESLARALRGTPEFVKALASALPRLEIRVQEATRDGEICHLRARVRNLGALPTGLAVSARRNRALTPLALELELPAGSRLIAGQERCALGRLLGGELSADCEWIVLAPAGSAFTLRARSEWTLPVARELRP